MPADPTSSPSDVADRIAAQTLARRTNDYAAEVRRLLDAALAVIAEHGTTGKARVADIVATAGMSNDAFYRHFPSKDALVAALIDDGAQRLASYVGHQMAKEATPEGQVRRWVAGVMSQTAEGTAAATRAVLAFGSGPFDRASQAPVAALLHEPLAALGSPDPELAASLATHAVMGRLTDHLWAGTRPTRRELDRLNRLVVELGS